MSRLEALLLHEDVWRNVGGSTSVLMNHMYDENEGSNGYNNQEDETDKEENLVGLSTHRYRTESYMSMVSSMGRGLVESGGGGSRNRDTTRNALLLHFTVWKGPRE